MEGRQQVRGLRRPAALGAALLASLAVAVPAATPAREAASRTVTLTLRDVGTGRWSITGGEEQGQMTMRYRWSGTFRFRIPARVLRSPGKARFKAVAFGTLRGSWTGGLSGRKLAGAQQGPYQCGYKGVNVETPVRAELSDGPGTRLELWLNARDGDFFPNSKQSATISCTTTYGQFAPPHFDPSWLFRDMVTVNARLTRNTAIVYPPSRLLPRGTVKLRFPYEVGRRDSNFTGNTRWSNRGTLTLTAR